MRRRPAVDTAPPVVWPPMVCPVGAKAEGAEATTVTGEVLELTGAPTAAWELMLLQPDTFWEDRDSALTRELKGPTTEVNAELLEPAPSSSLSDSRPELSERAEVWMLQLTRESSRATSVT